MADPADQRLVGRRTNLHPPPAAVRELGGCFLNQQAFRWRRRKDAAPTRFADHGVVVKVGVKTEQRQLKPVLAALLAVARSGVAAQGGEDRLDIEFEADRGAMRHRRRFGGGR